MIASCWNTFGRVLGAPAVVALGTDAVAFRHRSRLLVDPNPGMHHHNEREWGLVPEELGLSESIPVSSSRCASCDPVLGHYKTAYALRANARPTRVPRTGVPPANNRPHHEGVYTYRTERPVPSPRSENRPCVFERLPM